MWRRWEEGSPSASAGSLGVTAVPGEATEGGGRRFASRTAYMLHYTREAELEPADGDPAVAAPECLRAEVEAASEELRARGRAYEEGKAARDVAIAKRDAYVADVTTLLQQPPPMGEGCWVSADWLQRSLSVAAVAGSALEAGPVDHGPITCTHGGADPFVAQRSHAAMLLVSRDAQVC